MTISIKSNADGLSGAIQVNGVDVVGVNGNGLALKNLTPTSANSSGVAGTIVYDSTYVYICIAENTWKRAQLLNW